MSEPSPNERPDRPGSETPRAIGVVVAGGKSERMGGEVRKPYLELGGRTVLEHALLALAAAPSIESLVLVVHPDELEARRAWIAECPGLSAVGQVVAGGATRTDSVRAGVSACQGVDVVAVHDAARPFVRAADVQRAIERAAETGAALLACPVADTIQRSTDGATIANTLDRSELWAAQTPQCFRLAPFAELLERAASEGFTPTDDASLWRHYGGQVALVESGPLNFKLTRPADLELARALIAAREADTSQ
ncbi:MAG: 2-C-methyl-D-erythritol 4-phosphate cytidylyltransferase [Planctomycetota bacterium]